MTYHVSPDNGLHTGPAQPVMSRRLLECAR